MKASQFLGYSCCQVGCPAVAFDSEVGVGAQTLDPLFGMSERFGPTVDGYDDDGSCSPLQSPGLGAEITDHQSHEEENLQS